MRGLSILALMAAAALPGEGATPGAPPRGHVIVMFGARWCAPCMAEYRGLSALAAAAAPDRLALAWIDRPIAPPPELAPTVDALPPGDARRLAETALGEGYGLPSSAMLDSSGHACALWRSPLHPDDLKAMRLQCGRRSPSAT